MDDSQRRSNCRLAAVILCAPLLLGLIGCRSTQDCRTADYAAVVSSGRVALSDSTGGTVLAASAESLVPELPELAGPHPVDDYIVYALHQNPKIQAARHRIEAKANRVPQAASLEDPMLGAMGWPFFPNVPQQTAGRVTAEVTVSQKLPWHGKLQTQASAAEAETDMARAELAAAELEVVEQVKRAYYDLYYLQKAAAITRSSRALLVDLNEIAKIRLTANEVSQQDVLRALLELSEVDAELIRLDQRTQEAQAKLCRLLHVSPDTPVRAVDEIPAEQLPGDLDRLYGQAVAARPELHAQLAALQRDRCLVERARLDYYPDVTTSVEWGGMTTHRAMDPLADGIDMLGIGAMINVPLYRKRLDAGVREAEAQAVSTAREYGALRDSTQEEVKSLFVQAQSQQQLVKLFRDDVIPRATQTLEVSREAYRVGRVDFLQLIDNWRQVLKYQIAADEVESQLRQTLAGLERVVGGRLDVLPAAPPAVGEQPLPPSPSEPATPRG